MALFLQFLPSSITHLPSAIRHRSLLPSAFSHHPSYIFHRVFDVLHRNGAAPHPVYVQRRDAPRIHGTRPKEHRDRFRNTGTGSCFITYDISYSSLFPSISPIDAMMLFYPSILLIQTSLYLQAIVEKHCYSLRRSFL